MTGSGLYVCDTCHVRYDRCRCAIKDSRPVLTPAPTPMERLAERLRSLNPAERSELYALLEEH